MPVQCTRGETLILYASSPLGTLMPPEDVNPSLRIIVQGPLEDTDARALANHASRFKEVSLFIAHTADNSVRLRFLEHFPFLTEFSLYDFEFTHFDDLSYLPAGIAAIDIAQTRSKKLSLGFLRKHQSLKRLYLEAHTKDINTVSELQNLEDLTLRSITLPNLEIIKTNKKLLSLDIKLGGTKNLDVLPSLPALRYLELWLVNKISDVSVLSDLHGLQYFFLQSLKHVTAIPSLRSLAKLRKIRLEQMPGIKDMRPLAEAPNLVDFQALNMCGHNPEDFLPFKGHPTLRYAKIGLGSQKKNQAVLELLGLPSEGGSFRFYD